MLIDRDIVTGVIAKAVDPAKRRVEEIMATNVGTARESDAFAELLATMRRKEQMRTVVQAIASEQRRERNVRR
jgi:predicted CopG family antitoxin